MFNVGTKVGARRWPFSSGHPDGWTRPIAGRVLAVNDPAAWASTIAFPYVPSQDEVDRHLARLADNRISVRISDRVPVSWSFDAGPKVYWEYADKLAHYHQDLSDWKAARESARQYCLAELFSAA